MKYRTLASTGTSVSNLALGAMGFGTETEESEAFAILDRFVEAGGNLVDTANVYGGGASESLIGRWFAGRCKLTLSTVQPWACRSRSRCSRSTAWSVARSSTRSFPPRCAAHPPPTTTLRLDRREATRPVRRLQRPGHPRTVLTPARNG